MHEYTAFVLNHLPLSILFVALLGWLIFTEVQNRGAGGDELSPLETTQIMNHQNAVLVDVRADKEYQDGHILSAIHIPLAQINDQTKKLEKYRKRPIVVYCRTGQRSGSVCRRLRKHGFETVYHMRGGIVAWQKDNLPLTRK